MYNKNASTKTSLTWNIIQTQNIYYIMKLQVSFLKIIKMKQYVYAKAFDPLYPIVLWNQIYLMLWLDQHSLQFSRLYFNF